MARDYTVHSRNIERIALKRSDFLAHQELANSDAKSKLLERCQEVLVEGFSRIKLAKSNHGGKPTYKITSFEHELVLRLIGGSVQNLTGVKQSNRVDIVRSLKGLLMEGVDLRVYRLDIRSFFENIDTDELLERLKFDRAFSRQSLQLLEKFFYRLNQLGIRGVPRGMSISSILSEYALKEFDRTIRTSKGVFFYARFVDDIVVITEGRECPRAKIRRWRKLLPKGLEFNQHKSKWLECQSTMQQPPASQEFEYLGYTIEFSKPQSNPKQRSVYIDISPKKQNKIKSRIVHSAIKYISDGKYDDFKDRLKILTSNVTVYDQAKSIKRKVGIYYNYILVDGSRSQALENLDSFLRKFLLSKNGSIAFQLNARLTSQQKRRLLKLSFKSGFQNRTHTHFAGAKLAELMDCWKHV